MKTCISSSYFSHNTSWNHQAYGLRSLENVSIVSQLPRNLQHHKSQNKVECLSPCSMMTFLFFYHTLSWHEDPIFHRNGALNKIRNNCQIISKRKNSVEISDRLIVVEIIIQGHIFSFPAPTISVFQKKNFKSKKLRLWHWKSKLNAYFV